MSQPKNDDSQISAMETTPAEPGVLPEIHNNLSESGDAVTTEQGHAQALEQALSQPTTGSSPVSGSDDDAQGASPDPSPIDPALTATPTGVSSLPAIADDNDLIEKEWVDKAKQIVNQTKEDPHLQNKEIGKMRVDYLKKRYNKEVKLVEE